MKRLVIPALLLALQVPAQAMSIVDDDFAEWEVFHFIIDDPFKAVSPPNLSTGTGQQLETGGNSGAFLQFSHTIVSGDTSWIGGIKTDTIYDPTTNGEILNLSVTADVKSSSGVSAWQVVIEQAGQRYFSFPFGSISTRSGRWQSVSISNLTASNFDTNPWAGSLAGSSIAPPDGNYPNFGVGAAPIQFGFMFGNRVLGAGTVPNNFGLDNFSLTIESGAPAPPAVPEPTPPASVPEPSSLLPIAGIAILMCRRRLRIKN